MLKMGYIRNLLKGPTHDEGCPSDCRCSFKLTGLIAPMIAELERTRAWLHHVSIRNSNYCLACGALQLQKHGEPEKDSHEESCPLFYYVPED